VSHRVCPRVSRAAAPTAYSGRAAGYCGCAAPKERAARRALAASASHVAVEDGTPMSPDEDEAAVEEERAGDQRVWAQLVYNERHAPADQCSASTPGPRSRLRWRTTYVRWAVQCPHRIPRPDR
jgi:hypothetical protein